MRIGIGLPQLGRFADIDTLRRVAVAAEASGLSSLWAIDRLLVPVDPRSAYPPTETRASPLDLTPDPYGRPLGQPKASRSPPPAHRMPATVGSPPEPLQVPIRAPRAPWSQPRRDP